MPSAFRLAVGTLTALPIVPPRRIDASTAGLAMALAPLVALGLAAPTAAAVLIVDALGLAPLPTAVLAVALLSLMSRGLHLDGLADTADALTCSYDRNRALAVMRRGDVGPSGAATLVLVLGLQSAALAQAVETGHGPWVLVFGVVASRAVLAMACARGVPPARADGLGVVVASTVPIPVAVAVLAIPATLGALVLPPLLGERWWPPVLAVLAAAGVTALVLRRCVRRLGGITGDVLGACVECALTAALLVLAASA